jgi:long-chain fatty acid transport protein
MSFRTYAALAAVSASALLSASEAGASGFALREQSGSMLGQAFAGQNAYAMDPSIIFFNPAGMSALDGTQVSAIASFIFPSNEFNNDGSTTLAGPALLGSNEGGDAGVNALVPTAYAMTSFGDVRVGIGVNAPFGLTTEYDEDWIGRYAAITSSLRTMNVNPVVSYQVLPWLAIGGGAQIQKVDARLTNAEIFGAGPMGAIDGRTELQADDVGFGFTAGALITPMQGTQIGLGFRSSVKHQLEGEAEITPPSGPAVFRSDATADLETPETIGLSVYHQLTDRVGVAGTVEWTNWSRFDELRVKFANGAPDNVVEENWQDTFFVALGATYQVSESFTARAGVAYDQSPVQDDFRTARLPDADRFWVALGGTWEMNQFVSLDFGFTHIFVQDASIEENFVATPGPGLSGTLRGDYENSVDIFAVQANIRL